MWGDPGCPGHPDVEEQVDAMLQRVVDSDVSEALNETDRTVRYRAKFRTQKWLFDNQRLGRALCVPIILLLVIEHLLVDPRGFFLGP